MTKSRRKDGPVLIDESNLSAAWGRAVLHAIEHAGSDISPLVLSVTGFDASGVPQEEPAVRQELDKLLLAKGMRDVGDVAFTIFPQRLWTIAKGERTALFNMYQDAFRRYLEQLPRPSEARADLDVVVDDLARRFREAETLGDRSAAIRSLFLVLPEVPAEALCFMAGISSCPAIALDGCRKSLSPRLVLHDSGARRNLISVTDVSDSEGDDPAARRDAADSARRFPAAVPI